MRGCVERDRIRTAMRPLREKCKCLPLSARARIHTQTRESVDYAVPHTTVNFTTVTTASAIYKCYENFLIIYFNVHKNNLRMLLSEFVQSSNAIKQLSLQHLLN